MSDPSRRRLVPAVGMAAVALVGVVLAGCSGSSKAKGAVATTTSTAFSTDSPTSDALGTDTTLSPGDTTVTTVVAAPGGTTAPTPTGGATATTGAKGPGTATTVKGPTTTVAVIPGVVIGGSRAAWRSGLGPPVASLATRDDQDAFGSCPRPNGAVAQYRVSYVNDLAGLIQRETCNVVARDKSLTEARTHLPADAKVDGTPLKKDGEDDYSVTSESLAKTLPASSFECDASSAPGKITVGVNDTGWTIFPFSCSA